MPEFHHSVCGSGPVLLLVPGGAGHPMGLEGVTARLAERFTVVTYDPLGLSRGPVDEPVGDQRVEAWSENARRLLDTVLPAGDSAHVFGTSSGGIVALDLLTRFPERVRRVVAHEPPTVEVLPDREAQRAMVREVDAICRTEGVARAVERLGAGLEGRPWQPGPRQATAADGADAPPSGRAGEGGGAPGPDTPLGLFLAHVLSPFATHAPDVDALKGLSPRLALGVGRDSRGQLPRRTAESLAGLTGAELVEFPGGHLGCLEHPVEFADLLAGTLIGPRDRSGG
ncbi:alpha/beta fold hydrolase [Streptomyces siamensis]|uniref:Alpha/beta hydrolase n=1 Tax=Streptomyces siamensis TaxID=1274986 RepID=A0ABP9JM56_9ACTN